MGLGERDLDRQALRDYGLSIGIEFAALRDWALGQTVMFLPENADRPKIDPRPIGPRH
jgi:hypothetical protein